MPPTRRFCEREEPQEGSLLSISGTSFRILCTRHCHRRSAMGVYSSRGVVPIDHEQRNKRRYWNNIRP
jgi:hypothetical protein